MFPHGSFTLLRSLVRYFRLCFRLSLVPCFPVLLIILLLVSALRAQSSFPGYEAWPYSQKLSVHASGLARIALPADTLDHLALDFADLRLVGEDSAEIPWTIFPPQAPRTSVTTLRAADLEVTLEKDGTVVLFSRPAAASSLVSLQLATTATRFNKPARLEASDDGESWTVLLDKVPVHCAGVGTPVSELRLPSLSYNRYRLTLGDRGSAPIPVTGLFLGIQSVDTTPAFPGGLTLVRREEVAGETRLTLSFDGRGCFVSEISLLVHDPVFNRPLRLLERRYNEGRIEERVLVRGLISRVPTELSGAASMGLATEPALLRVEQTIPSREMVLVIENGDSPPLAMSSIAASYRPVQVAFPAPASGSCSLLAGAPLASRPAYDLDALNARLASGSISLPSSHASFLPFCSNVSFRADDRLPDFPLLGASLDRAAWSGSREVRVVSPGIQQLELDPVQLAISWSHLNELRLVKGDSQVPFIVERCTFSRFLSAPLKSLPPSRAGTCLWSLELPAAGVPLESLLITSDCPLFERRFDLLEDRRDARGEMHRISIGQGTWSRRSASESSRFALRVYQAPTSSKLFLETSNGDNLPIALSGAELRLPVIRLHFKTSDNAMLDLLFGNPKASAPAYDLRLVAAQILSATHAEAFLSASSSIAESPDSLVIRLSRHSSALFWVALILVAGTLLFIIARLLPKNPK